MPAPAQPKTLLAFRQQYAAETDLIKRVQLLWRFSQVYIDSFRIHLLPLLEKEIENCRKAGYKDGEVMASIYLTYGYFDQMEADKALMHIQHVLGELPNVESGEVRSFGQNFMAYMESHQGNYENAMDLIYTARSSANPETHPLEHGWLEYSLGVLYTDLKDYENSMKYFRSALQSFQRVNNRFGISRANTGIATVLIHTQQLNEAHAILLEAEKEYSDLESFGGLSRALNDLGLIEHKRGNHEAALVFYKKALDIRRNIPHQQGIATTLIEMGEVLLELNLHNEALVYLNEAHDLCVTIRNRSKLSRVYHLYYRIHREKDEHKNALGYFELYDKLKSEILGETSSHKIKSLETKIATEKAEKEAEIERLRNVELKSAYNIIEEKNKEILDSITYAKRIQHAILPNEKQIKKQLPESFVLYKPKDIVAGDFYWFFELNEDEFFIAVCDCTGHGVPGAMVSVVCHNVLNRTLHAYKLRDPGQILDKTRELIIEQFEKSDEDVKDGMDISLLYINKKTKELNWAGANNPLWLVRNNTLTEFKPDKQPIGKFIHPKPFTTHHFNYQKNDALYLMTDGYQDQFGGPKGKKFKASNLQRLILENSVNKTHAQFVTLDQAFEEWKGNLEQVDDVCIIGIRM